VTRVVWLVLAAALLAACGSYGTSTTSAGGRLTKVEWISAAGPREFDYNLELEIVNELTPRTWTGQLI